MADLIPQHDVQAEMSVLGACMLSPEALWDVLGTVTGADFYHPKHEMVFAAIAALASKNEPVDQISVDDELRRTGTIEQAGGLGYVHTLAGAVPTAANAGYYADIVRDRAVRRRMVAAGTRIVGWGSSAEGASAELVERARTEVDDVLGRSRVEVATIGSRFTAVVEDLDSKPSIIPTPWRELNDVLIGLSPGRFYVLGARPGEGKSLAGMQLAGAMTASGPVAFSSLEMTRDELLQRMIAAQASVHMGSIERSTLSREEWERVAAVRPTIEAMPLYVDDASDVTVTQIKAHARSVSRKGKLGGVVVDYLQLISGPQEKRYEVVSEVSRQLKIMAKELDCPVVALSQLSRDSAGVGKMRRAPTLQDLRESGSIEQDADVVILLQRELDEDGKPGIRIRFDVAKNRHGKTGFRTLFWDAAYARISSWNRNDYQLPIPD